MGRPKRGQLHLSKPKSRNRTSHLPHEKRNEPTITSLHKQTQQKQPDKIDPFCHNNLFDKLIKQVPLKMGSNWFSKTANKRRYSSIFASFVIRATASANPQEHSKTLS